MNTAQKAQITVTDANGTDITAQLGEGEVTSSDPEVVSIHVDGGVLFAHAEAEGDAYLQVSHDGQDGELLVSVDPGTLTITLGAPVPK